VASPHYNLALRFRDNLALRFRDNLARRFRDNLARRFRALFTLTALAVTLAMTVIPAATAQADPAAAGAAAQAQVQALADKAEIVVEKYDAAQGQLAAQQLQLSTDRDAIVKAQQTLDSAQILVDGVARAAYESGNLDGVTSVLLSQDPQLALQGADTLERLAADQARELNLATTARNTLVQAQAAAAQVLAGVQASQAALAAQQKTITALIGRQQAAMNATQAATQAAQVATQVATGQASRGQARVALVAAPNAAPAVVPAIVPAVLVTSATVSGRAAAAVRYAYAQLGKRYRYGAAGAITFDCSGLTMRAWAAAGVSLGHNAAAQYASTHHVARSALQPGDLVYFGHPIHHVGIYIGGGRFIEAPYTGADIRISNLSSRHDFAGASRP
jgi:cell wall-associated NlpC family hydrolase